MAALSSELQRAVQAGIEQRTATLLPLRTTRDSARHNCRISRCGARTVSAINSPTLS